MLSPSAQHTNQQDGMAEHAVVNGDAASSQQVYQLAFSLPRAADTTISLHLTNTQHTLLLFVASSTIGAPAVTAPLGSFVYALPNVCVTRQ